MKRKAKRISQDKRNSLSYPTKRAYHIDDGFGTSLPPDIQNVQIYFDQKGMSEYVLQFFNELEKGGWKYKFGRPVRNWKEAANEWICDLQFQIKLNLKRSAFHNHSLKF